MGCGSVVVVNTAHVVAQVPVAREPISWKSAVATLIAAQVGLVSMSMHGVGLTLMSKKAGGGREPGVLARINLATVWLQVRVHELAVFASHISIRDDKS